MSAQITDITIDAGFDGGNIRLVKVDGETVDLEIVTDKDSDFYQWFYFRAAGVRGRNVTYRIVNCGGAAYPAGWPGYRARVSHDLSDWRQAETEYADGVLSFTDTAPGDCAWFAYFAPYTWEMHNRLVARTIAKGGAHRVLGHSLEGRAIDCFDFPGGKTQVWLYARQHPGESMAEWWMEGALDWLTSDAAAPLLARASVHVVPNMNPDGTYRGHLRTNAAGVNLNREWDAPTPERSPEVLCVRDAMDATGVNYAIDVHGDEAIPANFTAGFDGIPRWTKQLGARYHDFGRRLAAKTREFQIEQGYPPSAPGTANLSMSTNQVAERYGALSMTLEMPFKDHDPNPDAVHGWSPDRSKALAVAMLELLTDTVRNDEIDIRQGLLDDPRVRTLIEYHREESRSCTPAENAHSMDADGLRNPAVTFLSAWKGEQLMGIGAIRELDANHAELKSMRTDPAHLRKGVSRILLDHLIGIARARGYMRLSLETGTAPMFDPANEMYARYGFVDCPAFAGYPESPHNRFMTLKL